MDQHVIGQDAVHVVILGPDAIAQVHRKVEAQPLGAATLGLEGADFGLNDMVAQMDAVWLDHACHSPQIPPAGKPAGTRRPLVRGDALPARTVEDVLPDPHRALKAVRP